MSSSVRKPRAKPWQGQVTDVPEVADSAIVGPTKSTPVSEGSYGTTDSAPELPKRPAVLESETDANNMRSNVGYQTGMYGQNGVGHGGGYGGSMYGAGLGSLYGSSGYGSMYGSGYGSGYGSMYGAGGYGSMMGGYGATNMYGMGGMNGNGAQGLAESTQATFQLIESLIGAVAGFAQMLEATYMATHNSFFTMVSMAEQIASLKEMLGSFLGIFAAMKMLKKLLYKVTSGRLGTAPQRKSAIAGPKSELAKEFDNFRGRYLEREKRGKKRISWKPLVIFLAAVFGFPFLLRKFIARLAEIQQRKTLLARNNGSGVPSGLDPRNLEFARATYDFTPENPQIEVRLQKGDLMAVMSKTDPMGRESEWWKVRTKKGDVGYVPSNYLELIRRRVESVESVGDVEKQ
ncbi:LAME_0C04412g1_1 [Lachancea meyersii CBS 8951]|uniref:Peroxisomal membrane protein PEX13 n=1 Tax=Lachancea meyersii CBS 8951 TaxID=1266667 RepID=A0A1G4J0Y2_9SACH|nr:LAME_0C04412g1_1 [Lachancea meyersii CBS 8951]